MVDPKLVLFPVLFLGLRQLNLQEHEEMLKFVFLKAMAVLFLLHLFLGYLIVKADNKTSFSFKDENGVVKQTTVKDYDILELRNKILMFPLLVAVAFGLYSWKGAVQPFAMMPIMQTITLVTNPLVWAYVLKKDVPRPFGTKPVPGEVTRTESSNQDKKKAKKTD